MQSPKGPSAEVHTLCFCVFFSLPCLVSGARDGYALIPTAKGQAKQLPRTSLSITMALTHAMADGRRISAPSHFTPLDDLTALQESNPSC